MASEFTTVATYDNALDAHMIRGFLESRGIPSQVVDENMVSLYPLISSAFGGVKLMVRRTDLDAAQSLVDEFEHHHASADGDAGSDAGLAEEDGAPVETEVATEDEPEPEHEVDSVPSIDDSGSDSYPPRVEVIARRRSRGALLSIILPLVAPIFLILAFWPLEGAQSSPVARRHLRNAKVFASLGMIPILIVLLTHFRK